MSRTLPTSLLNALRRGSRLPWSSVRGRSAFWRSEGPQEKHRTASAARHSPALFRNRRKSPLGLIAGFGGLKLDDGNSSLLPCAESFRFSNFRFRVWDVNGNSPYTRGSPLSSTGFRSNSRSDGQNAWQTGSVNLRSDRLPVTSDLSWPPSPASDSLKKSSAVRQVRVRSGFLVGRRSNSTLPRWTSNVHNRSQSSMIQREVTSASRMCRRTLRSRPVRTKARWMIRRAARLDSRDGTIVGSTSPTLCKVTTVEAKELMEQRDRWPNAVQLVRGLRCFLARYASADLKVPKVCAALSHCYLGIDLLVDFCSREAPLLGILRSGVPKISLRLRPASCDLRRSSLRSTRLPSFWLRKRTVDLDPSSPVSGYISTGPRCPGQR
jgi:hypothetical protein